MMTTTPLEAFVCREVRQRRSLLDESADIRSGKVIELYFFRDQPYDQRRHFIITTGLIVVSMSSKPMHAQDYKTLADGLCRQSR
jgi:hypothetical protein